MKSVRAFVAVLVALIALYTATANAEVNERVNLGGKRRPAALTSPSSRRAKTPLPESVPKIVPPGGASPLAKQDIAKFATVLSIVNAGLISLAPAKTLEMYGLARTPLTEYMTEWIGHLSACQAIAMWSLHYGRASVNKAAGAAVIYLAITSIKSLLNDMPKKIGFAAGGQVLYLAIDAICGRALLTDAPYATGLLKANAAWSLLSALPFCFAPDYIGGQWGLEPGDALVRYELKQTGYVIAAKAVYFGSLALGVDPAKALGFNNIPLLVGMLITNFVTKDVGAVGMGPTMQYVFMALKLFFIATLALD
mmetsp:Transcript_16986/g.34862  ORF Transcript_16986/g.34862 Transcript_16986/m.34862 type:complete len:309 (-) Transcript_16986:344-1270(-)|eukprot:CAMPEP_0183309432 /NCGR_PEP_ID=MMETSP0160_2-20130417/25338_1 /TAXON_ID=2839 ORGANISM="Odontella Sinensis, Strain Grunow 1884" /NCGR_SAMPLE_ID=MMETSP0160_2 /ASSEMBLY_ACC=CAM_ASM_000250 /LENGTH=308 /DNA_ID=CAMNT_0025473459 /DNA_START=64 /DNA_END=990 /DNA_ORIENTATION=+